MSTYLELKEKFLELENKVKEAWATERKQSLATIADSVRTYQITEAELRAIALAAAKSASTRFRKSRTSGSKQGKKGSRSIGARSSVNARAKVPAKYRDQAGREWSGRGKTPIWMQTALASGAQKEDFLIDRSPDQNKEVG